MKLDLRSVVWVGAAMLMPVGAYATSVMVNGTCELGTCQASDAVSYGQSQSGNISIPFTVNSDSFLITGNYSGSYGVNGTEFVANVFATYTGAKPTTTTDALTIDVLQNFYDNSPGNWDGAYTETVPLTLTSNAGSGSTVAAQLFWDGQGLPLVGPYGPGSYNVVNTASLSGLDAATLAADYRFTFTFAPGTMSGATAGSPGAIPEPATAAQFGLGAAGLGIAALVMKRRRRMA